MTVARRVIMDHSLMAMAEQYTGNMFSPAESTEAIQFLKDHVLNTTDYPDRERMEFWGVADMTTLEMAEYALTAPLTEKERNPAPLTYYDTMMGIGNDDVIEIKARSYAEAELKFNRLAMLNDPPADTIGAEALTRKGTNSGIGFYGNFGDGLPLVGPTRELVNEMLAGSERSGTLIGDSKTGYYSNENDVLGWLKFQGGAITPLKVATNAVMAGAKPEHFPVILAAMELMAGGWDFDKMWYHGLVTGSDSTLHIMLNGPLAKELGVSGAEGSFGGAGNEVNNVIGRAIRLCFRNIGHVSWEMDDHQYKGREHDFALIVFRELEEELPGWNPNKWDGNARPSDKWVPYHVFMGFRPEESTITIWAGNSTGGVTYGGEPDYWANASLQEPGTGTGDTNYFFPIYNMGGWQTYNTLDSGAINVIAISPGMAREMYETHNIRSKTDLINTAQAPAAQSPWLPSPPDTRASTVIPVVAGGSPSPVRLFGNYSFYGRQNYQIQLISGATLTKHGRAASVTTTNNHVGLLGRTSAAEEFLNPPTVPAPKGGKAYLPSAPQNVQVKYSPASNGDPGRRDATITWDPPLDDGNSPIVAYQLAFAHGGNIQFFLTTPAPDGMVDLAKPPTEVRFPYSLYNTAGGTQISGANRIYTIQAGSEAFANRTFTFQNIPVGCEVFFRVRAVSGVRNSVELDGPETIGVNGAFVTHTTFTEHLSIRTSGRGAWGLVPGHQALADPGA